MSTWGWLWRLISFAYATAIMAELDGWQRFVAAAFMGAFAGLLAIALAERRAS